MVFKLLTLSDILRFALTVLRERRLRAILTIIGISIGPAAMVTIIGTAQGYSNTIIDQLAALGENTMVVLPSGSYTLSDSDIRYFKGLEGVYSVAPFYTTGGVYKRSDGTVIEVSIYAVDLDELFKSISSLEVENGSKPSPTAYISALIGHDLAYDDGGRNCISIGDVIAVKVASVEENEVKIKVYNFRVVGILAKYGSALVMNPDKTIYLPLQSGKTVLGLKSYSGVLITAKDAKYVPLIMDRIKNKYQDLIEVIAFERISASVGSVISALNFLLYSLSLSSFVVAVTGIMATMFTSVMERTREIGVLKALGYTSKDVLTVILAEAVIMSLLGGIIGISIGTVGAYILASRSFHIGNVVIVAAPAINADLLGYSMGMAISTGIVGGLIPAYKASRVMPVEALRYE